MDESGWSALREDLQRLTDEAELLADNLQQNTRLAREEAVGAELLASRELVTHFAIAWDAWAGYGELLGRQASYLVSDYATTCADLLAPADATARGAVVGDHLQRRMQHIGEGLEQGVALGSSHLAQCWDSAMRFWSPFLSVVRQDWATRTQRPGQ